MDLEVTCWAALATLEVFYDTALADWNREENV